MSKEINLETIFNEIITNAYPEVYDTKDEIIAFAREACKQTLELAAENAHIYNAEGGIFGYDEVDKKSILDTINQIK